MHDAAVRSSRRQEAEIQYGNFNRECTPAECTFASSWESRVAFRQSKRERETRHHTLQNRGHAIKIMDTELTRDPDILFLFVLSARVYPRALSPRTRDARVLRLCSADDISHLFNRRTTQLGDHSNKRLSFVPRAEIAKYFNISLTREMCVFLSRNLYFSFGNAR